MEIKIDIENVLACPMCGGTNIPQLYTRQHGNLQANYSFCQDCKFIFLNPRMTDKFTEIYYRDYYRQVTLQSKEIVQRNLVNQRQRAEIQSFLLREWNILGDEKLASHLDVGCSAGYLLEAVGAKSAIGVDYDEYHPFLGDEEPFDVELPKDNYVVYSQLEDVPGMAFSIITMSHSLEHINHPVEYLQNLTEKFADDKTVFVIEVPDAMHNQDAFLLHHPIAYYKDSLFALFQKFGLHPINAVNHGLGAPLPLYLVAAFCK